MHRDKKNMNNLEIIVNNVIRQRKIAVENTTPTKKKESLAKTRKTISGNLPVINFVADINLPEIPRD